MMKKLPPPQTPLNQHSLASLEIWLADLGARQSSTNCSIWICSLPDWTTTIQMEEDELKVTWDKHGELSSCSFSYRLLRIDVESVISQGPI